jgi:hypothetical protein
MSFVERKWLFAVLSHRRILEVNVETLLNSFSELAAMMTVFPKLRPNRTWR